MTTEALRELSTRLADAILLKLTEAGPLESDSLLHLQGSISQDAGEDERTPNRHIDFGTLRLNAPLQHSSRSSCSEENRGATTSKAHNRVSAPVDGTPPLRDDSARASVHASRASPDAAKSGRSKRRKVVAGLHLGAGISSTSNESEDFQEASIRRLQSDAARVPRRKPEAANALPKLLPASLDNFVLSIWQQIYSSMSFDMNALANQWRVSASTPNLILCDKADTSTSVTEVSPNLLTRPEFSRVSVLCKRIGQASRSARALEVVVEAHWIDCFDDEVQAVLQKHENLSATKARMFVLAEACRDFGYTEKELRNKLAIWRGYKELKDAGGWVVLIFAGMGLYRFCKYRLGFTPESMKCLQRLHTSFEVAADTLHPQWRQMLSIIGHEAPARYSGHPHDWVICDTDAVVPLAQTYLQWDPNFSYAHLVACVVDKEAWGSIDPRAVEVTYGSDGIVTSMICATCGELQSDIIGENQCACFPNLYGAGNDFRAVQVMRAKNKNNGLYATLPYERGTAIGEFVGRITRGLKDVDVMEGETPLHGRYQIWQGREGNYTRFINHSCRPNSQFQRFIWRGLQRVIIVSKGVLAGQEITVDYSHSYWRDLDKICQCGEACCRYTERRHA